MKTLNIFIAFFCLTIISCSSSDNEEQDPETAEPFVRENQLQFYFSSPANTDLLNLNNNIIVPIAYEGKYNPSTLPPKNNSKKYVYQGGTIEYDAAIDKYYWSTGITGKKGIKKNTIFVRITETDTDTLDVNFKFTKGEGSGADKFYAYIEKLYYNDILIHEENSNKKIEIDPVKRIFIQKNGKKTLISFMN
ncbi:hypothetical protein [Flavobacterium marginilacus]|uniref:hypothetical protein n=1 Tax=Flavobacterium marginilacus TaxID=3003256 RepID=UPI00248F2CAB|nr:hypothetical protein [Flavobacterium marginilacus]